jgi:hypothetical protein
MPMPEVVKGASGRKRRKKILPEVTQQEVVGLKAFGTAAPVELRTSVEIGSASTTPLPSSQAPAGVQWVGLGASHELPPAFKQMGQQQQQQQQQGTSEEAGDMTSSPAAKKSKGHKKKMGAAAAPSTEEQQHAEIIATTTMVAEKSSADYLIKTLEEKKEARYCSPNLNFQHS